MKKALATIPERSSAMYLPAVPLHQIPGTREFAEANFGQVSPGQASQLWERADDYFAQARADDSIVQRQEIVRIKHMCQKNEAAINSIREDVGRIAQIIEGGKHG